MTRICKTCKAEKDIREFRSVKKVLLGGDISITHRWECKECSYANRNIEKVREYGREWKKKYRQDHKKSKEQRHVEYLKSRDRQLQYHVEYYQEHKEAILEYGKKYRRTPVGRKKLRDSFHKYEAIKRDAYVEYVDRDLVYERDKGICHICHAPTERDRWHLEHIIPLSRGGTHCYANVAVSHPECNVSKKNKTLLEFLDFKEKRKNESNRPKRPYYKNGASSDSKKGR